MSGAQPIGKSNMTIPSKRLTPEALWALGRIGEFDVDPHGERVVYSVKYFSVAQNKGATQLYVMNTDSTNKVCVTADSTTVGNPRWIDNGSRIAYLSSASGTVQIWSMLPDGTDKKQISKHTCDIEGFSFSPDEKYVLFVSSIKYGQTTADIYPDLPLASGRIVTDLMYRHWDEWVDKIPHPYVATYHDGVIGSANDILQGEPYECPMKPFGGMEMLDWDPTSTLIAYSCKKKTGKEYSLSTDSNIYIYDTTTGKTVMLTTDNHGYDTNPKFSPDGKMIAWQSMERDGYESDQNRLIVMNRETGEKTFVSQKFESSVDSFIWDKSSKCLFFVGVWHGTIQMYRVACDGSELKEVTSGVHDLCSMTWAGDMLLVSAHSMSKALELYLVSPQTGEMKEVTFENKHIYDQIEMGEVKERWIETTDHKQMLTWVIFPPNFDSTKKYPAILFCEGGPQCPVSQWWSYRWNFQVMAASGYIVVAPNRRGMPGFGLEWNEEISGDYGGQCMKDLLSAIDTVSREPYVDEDKLGCVGASFGGYSVYWLAGHHEKRFKAFIAHDGIFNLQQQYVETDEMWFSNWDMGGPYWEKDNKIAQKSFKESPHLYVDKWDTPILCIHGEQDFRILSSQGHSAFNAAVLRGIPAELLLYPDENHWVLKPQNSILWQRRFRNWLDRWLK